MMKKNTESKFQRVQESRCGHETRYEHILKYVEGHSKNPIILDVGCGKGFLTNLLREDGFRCIGIDIGKETLADLRATAEALPFKSEIFDIVICSHVLEHLSDPSRGLQEIGRVLKRDGTVIIAIPNMLSPLSLLGKSISKIRGKSFTAWDPTHKQLLNIFQWMKKFELAGFKIKRVNSFARFGDFLPKKFVILNRLLNILTKLSPTKYLGYDSVIIARKEEKRPKICLIYHSLSAVQKKGDLDILIYETKKLQEFSKVIWITLRDPNEVVKYFHETEHLSVYPLSPPKGPRELQALWLMLKIFHIIWKERPDVIRGYEIVPSLFGISGKMFNIPLISSFHTEYRQFWSIEEKNLVRYALLHIAEKLSLKFFNILVSPSSKIRDYMLYIGTPPSKIKVIQVGVDLNLFKPSRVENIEKNIVFVGRLDKVKNVDILIRAMPHVLKKHPTAHLHIVGDGPLRQQLELTTKELKICDNIHFEGFIPHQELPKFLAKMSVFVLPSSVEGCPKALIQAMGMGKAAIASNIPAIREVITDKVDGFLVKEINPERFADAICSLLDSPELRRELGLNAVKKASRFDIEKVTQRWINLYKRILVGVK